MKKSVERLSLRKRLALEVFRRMRENQKALHPLKQLFVVVIASALRIFPICLPRTFCVWWTA